MHYSLVSSPVLGFDLVRVDGGSEVAGILLRGLACGPAELGVLAGRHDAAARERAWPHVRAVSDRRPSMPQALSAVADGLDELAGDGLPGRRMDAALRLLRSSTIADADALVRLVHGDVLDWTWTARDGVAVRSDDAARGADVLADAAVAAYLSARLAPEVVDVLSAPYRAGLRALPEPRAAAGPDLPEGVRAVLDRLATLDVGTRAALEVAAERSRGGDGQWAVAVHDASWAVHLTGRTRTAAAAQLHAVQGFVAAGLAALEDAAGLWNLVSGVVHAEMVADLLGEGSRALLVRPWLEATTRD